jgi:hypothetical protein
MVRAIISLKDKSSENIVKEARKKAIDNNISFTEAVLMLLAKWIAGDVTIKKDEDKNLLLFK